MPKNLTKEQQLQIKQVVDRAKNKSDVPRTAQESIPFERMFPDGICRVGADYYTKTIQFQDINYQLAQQEDKTEIFEEWCAFLNFFDSSVHFELSFMNMATDAESFERSIAIPHRKDDFNGVRDEYSSMLFHQMEAGNNGLTKTKYLTFGIHADSMKTAKPRLIHIEMDLLNNFKRLGVSAHTLNGTERLELMHRQFHMGDNEKFMFDSLINSKIKSDYLLFEEKKNSEYNHLGIAVDAATQKRYIETFFHQSSDMYIRGQQIVKVKSFTLYTPDNQIIVSDSF